MVCTPHSSHLKLPVRPLAAPCWCSGVTSMCFFIWCFLISSTPAKVTCRREEQEEEEKEVEER